MSETSRQVTRLASTQGRIAEMLDETKWASEFTWSQLQTISEHLCAYGAKQGAVLVEEGDIDQSISIIVQGAVTILKSDHHGTMHRIATVRSSQSLGEMAVIDGEPRSARAEAATDVVMLVLTKDGFFRLAENAPLLAFRLLWKISSMISRRLRKSDGHRTSGV